MKSDKKIQPLEEKCLNLFLEGNTTDQIAKMLGYHPSYIRDKITSAKRKIGSEELNNTIRNLRKTQKLNKAKKYEEEFKLGVKQLSERLGLSINVLRPVLFRSEFAKFLLPMRPYRWQYNKQFLKTLEKVYIMREWNVDIIDKLIKEV